MCLENTKLINRHSTSNLFVELSNLPQGEIVSKNDYKSLKKNYNPIQIALTDLMLEGKSITLSIDLVQDCLINGQHLDGLNKLRVLKITNYYIFEEGL